MNEKKPSPQIQEMQKTLSDEGVDSVSDVKEIGGFENRLEPTRYGDWDVNGRCSDF